jgi:hypothetical protein
MPRNGSGTFTLVSGNPVVSGTVIESTWANNTLADIADSITNSLARNGEGGMTAALRLVDGTVSVPGLAFANETGSGVYRAAAGDIGLTVLGSRILRLQAAGATVTGTLTTGNLVVDDNSTLGSSNTDTLAVNARITTDLEPNDNNAKDIGTSGRNWRDGFFGRNLSVGGTLGVTGVATFTANPTLGSGAVNGVPYLNGSKSLVSGSNLVFDGSKLGIGASSPYSTLDVGTTGAEVLTSVFTTGVSDLNFRIGFSNGVSGSSGSNQGKLGLFYLGVGEAASVSFIRGGGATDASMAFRTNNAERMRITDAGNVGIGTSSPGQRLSLASSTNDDGIRITNTSAANTTAKTTRITFFGTDTGNTAKEAANIYTIPDGVNYIGASMAFFTRGSDTMKECGRFDPSGNLLVGTTSTTQNARLNVTKDNTTGNTTVQNIFNSACTSTTKLANILIRISSNASSADTCINLTDNVSKNYFFGGNNGGAYVVANSNGVRLAENGTSWASDSDERVKDIIEPITDAAQKVSTLRSVIGKYKTDTESTRRVFLIAQDVQAVLPEAVFDEQGTLMLSYTDVIPLLTAAIQEQQDLITKIQVDVAALKAL